MDINYLLLLQNFRESTQNVLSPFLMWMSDFAISFWPVAFACMVFWVFDRQAGKRILAGFGLGAMMNGLLKLTFRITRPWLRDDRVLPYGNSKVTATGYSFPSGHSTFATAMFGGVGWWQRNRNKVLSILLIGAMVLTMFSRNYLGVHTPQDVLVGFGATALMMFIAAKIEDWTDKDPKRDFIVLAAGLVVCVILYFYYQSIPIEPLFDEAGTLIVDPIKMKADSFEGIGFLSSFVICRCFERRFFHFDTELKKKDRFIICVFALIPMYWWYTNIMQICEPISRALGRFAIHAGVVVYTMIIVPFVMSKIRLPKWMREEEAA